MLRQTCGLTSQRVSFATRADLALCLTISLKSLGNSGRNYADGFQMPLS